MSETESKPRRRTPVADKTGLSKGTAAKGISAKEIRDVEDRSAPRTPVIYEVVRRLGEEEMERPVTSLWWSGVAAGMSMSFSLLTQAILEHALPDTAWRPLVAGFGYSVGFLMTILGRQQLFTESTITVVLPVLKELTALNLWRMGRLWAIVLIANLVGTLFAALFCTYAPVLKPDALQAMIEVSRNLLAFGWWEMLFRGIASGFLIAAMVWMIPSAETAKLIVIALMTWLIAIGGFTHIIAGSMESYLLVLHGDWMWWQAVLQFFVPVLIGNMIGGTALFAMISYAQVMEEI
jgi:formate/nitrite transporter FocA (FNT family)